MKDLKNKFNELTVVEMDGKNWYIGREVCYLLGYQVSGVSCTLNQYAKEIRKSPYKKGGKYLNMISEADFYSMIIRSTHDEARYLSDWLCEEVLPSIRKTGGYSIEPSKDFIKQLENKVEQLKLGNNE